MIRWMNSSRAGSLLLVVFVTLVAPVHGATAYELEGSREEVPSGAPTEATEAREPARPAEEPEEARPRSARPRLLVMDLQEQGAAPELVVMLTEEVVAAARDTGRWEVLSAREIRELLGVEAQRQMMGCEDSSCAIEIAGAVEARDVVSGMVTTVGRTTQVRMRLLETDAGRVGGWVTVSSRSSDELRDLVRRATFEIAGVSYRARHGREIAWAERDIGAGFSVRRPDEHLSTSLGLTLSYQHRFGRFSVGPSVSYSLGDSSVLWEDLFEDDYEEDVRVSSFLLGAGGRWPSTGGEWVRGYVSMGLGILVGSIGSMSEDAPDWVTSAGDSSFGVYAMPGVGLRLLPRARLGFAIEAHWILMTEGLRLFDHAPPLAGEGPPRLNERRVDLDGLSITGVVRYGF